MSYMLSIHSLPSFFDQDLTVSNTTSSGMLLGSEGPKGATCRGEHRARIYGYTGPRNMGPVTVPSGLEGPALRDGVRDGYPPYQAVK